MSLDPNTFDPEYRELLKQRFADKFCELNMRLNEEEYTSFYYMLIRRYGTVFTNECEDAGLALFESQRSSGRKFRISL